MRRGLSGGADGDGAEGAVEFQGVGLSVFPKEGTVGGLGCESGVEGPLVDCYRGAACAYVSCGHRVGFPVFEYYAGMIAFARIQDAAYVGFGRAYG